MKYIIGLHALIFLIVILMGCNSTPNRSILRQVESYMEEHPDSALFLLNSIAHPENYLVENKLNMLCFILSHVRRILSSS